jgi:DNA-binding NarL/FixJ family response regulator
LLRQVLAERLAREPSLAVVGTCESADAAIAKTIEAKPDVILMDIDMPGLICFDAAKRILSMQPSTRIIFLSAFLHDHYIEQALRAKASGYLTKREPFETVVAAILEVASGGAYFSEEVRSRIVVDSRGAQLAEESRSLRSTITARETEILRYIARGLAKKEIAQTMGISVKTVDRHAANLMSKLDIHDRVELTRFAIREGLVDV